MIGAALQFVKLYYKKQIYKNNDDSIVILLK